MTDKQSTRDDASTAPDESKRDPQQQELARGTPPSRIPGTTPDTDLQPEQQPLRDKVDPDAPDGQA